MSMIQLVKLSLPARTVLTAIVDGTYTPGDGDQSLRAAARTWKGLAARGFVTLDVLLSGQTGHIIDIRREDGPAALANG